VILFEAKHKEFFARVNFAGAILDADPMRVFRMIGT
jgi:hypothetical protein